MNLYKQIKHWSNTIGNQPVFISNSDSLTYRELDEKSDSIAVFLENSLKEDKSPIAVYGHMEPMMLVLFLGIVKSGRAYIPIDDSTPNERISSILEGSRVKTVLSPKEIPLSIQRDNLLIIQSEQLLSILDRFKGQSVPSEKHVKEDENFYILYTSGSTGNPKGVQISYRNLISFVEWMMDDFNLLPNQVFINQALFSFDLSVMDVYPSLFLGGTLWCLTKELMEKPKYLFENLKESNANVWVSTPSFADICLSNADFSDTLLPHLHTFLFCGETLTNETAKNLRKQFPNAVIYNTYGPTEATVAVTSIKVTYSLLEEYKTLPIGFVKSDTNIVILNEENEVVPNGEKGQMVIVGPSVSKGYLNQKEITEKSFFLYENQPAYRTGDLGYQKDGLYFYGGRMDFQVKINGYRMEIEEIETHLRTLELVKNTVVIPQYKDGKCQSLIALVIVESNPYEKEFQLTSALKKELQKKVPTYMVPRKFKYIPSFPMTNNGKIDRKKLASEVLS